MVTGEKAEMATTDAATTVAVNFISLVVWLLVECFKTVQIEIVRTK